MGSSSSKPARKLAKEATSSGPLRSAAASRPSQGQTAPPPPPPRQSTYGDRQQARSADDLNTTGMRGAKASETKTQAVQDDGRDPQLLANLQKLGQVQVPRGKVQFQPSNPMLSILSARQHDSDLEREANETAAQTSGGVRSTGMLKNRMPASAIVAMLDARKECRTQADLEQVARGFDVDVDVMQRLARYVNAPSVDAGARLRQKQNVQIDEGDDALERIEAIWTEPALEDVKEIRG